MSRCLIALLSDFSTAKKQTLDLVFRLSFLEGVARKEAGEWTRNPIRGAVEARAFFEAQQIPVDPQWFGPLSGTPWVRELDHRTYWMVRKYQDKLSALSLEADDIANDLVMATNSPTGRRQDKVFYSFGLSWGTPEDLENTPPNAKEVMGPGLTRALSQYINKLLKIKKNQTYFNKHTPLDRPEYEGYTDEERDGLVYHEQSSPVSEADDVGFLIDMMGDQLGLGNTLLRLADSAIDRITDNEIARFAMKRFFGYLADPTFNTYSSGAKKDKHPDRSKMWAMLAKIREQVREDMLAEFNPNNTMTEEEKAALSRSLYRIIGSGERGSKGDAGLPRGIEKVLTEIRKTPAVERLIERFKQERERLELRSLTASIVRTHRWRKAKASLGLWGLLLGLEA